MSAVTKFKIELTPEAKRIVANLQNFPAQISAAIAAGMNRANQDALAKVKVRLIGTGPFPAEQNKLGRRSGSLYAGVFASPAVPEGNTVRSGIGTNTVKNGFSYAALHEFGGRVNVKGREHKVRLKTNARGQLARQANHPKLAVFAGRAAKHSVERTGHSADHVANYPERAPFRTGIGEAMPSYKRNISASIVRAWAALKK